MRQTQTNILFEKLEAFLRKHYTNQIIKGVMFFVAASLSLFILLSITEYLGEFESTGRGLLFAIFAFGSLLVFYKWLAVPLLYLFKIKKGLSYFDAAKLIGAYFSDVNDKILNTLQLLESSNDSFEKSILLASIEQKTSELKPIDFGSVVRFSENKKYLKYAAIPFGVGVIIFFVNARILTESSKRLVLFNKHFEKKAPYEFIVLTSLETLEEEDKKLEIKLKGSALPEKIFIRFGDEKHLLNKEKGVYQYTFKSPRKSIEFYFTDEEFSSAEYTLQVQPKPMIRNLVLKINYPKYTLKEPVDLNNIGDAIVPEGTELVWEISPQNADTVSVVFPDSMMFLSNIKKNVLLNKVAKQSFDYSIFLKNQFTSSGPINYQINVVKDEFPKITFQEEVDSLTEKVRYFYGNVLDDYGFSALNFCFKKTSEKTQKKVALPITKIFVKDQFYYQWDMGVLNLMPGDEVEYYFEIWDNDGVNGAKFSRSSAKIYKAPTLEELSELSKKSNENIKDSFDEALKEAQQMQKELDELQKNILNKKNLNWEDKSQIESFLNRQKSLEKSLDQLQKENLQKNSRESDFKDVNPNILEKQMQLEKLFEELMNDEMKKLYEELEKMLEQLNKDDIQKTLEELSMKQEDIEEQLDRSLELFKQLEFDQKLVSLMERLEKLSKEEKNLSEESLDKTKNKDDLLEKQKEIDDKFQQIKEDLKSLEKLNEELENKREIENTSEAEKEIGDNLEKSQEELKNNNSKKASGAQKKASEKMQQMKQQLQQSQQSQQQQQTQEDIASLRMLLENLIQFSFDQENLLENFKITPPSDPKYLELGREQRKLQDDSQIIKDSLNALAKRVFQLKPFVTKELSEMNENIIESISNISDRKTPYALVNQQRIMTSANNLALMLEEVLNQLQQQSASQQPGTGSCNKPGGMGQSPSMQQMQQQLQQQLQQMKKQMEQQKGDKPGEKDGGKKPNGQTPGGSEGKGGLPGNSMSKELSKMAAQQEAIRKEIQRMAQELNKDGSGSGNGLNDAAKKLEEIEKDLVNKRITEQTIKRQQDIITRLLEHDKAQREQEQDNKRESNEVKNQKYSNPNKYFEYKRKKEQEVELLKTIPPSLNDYYKNKVNEYFNLYE